MDLDSALAFCAQTCDEGSGAERVAAWEVLVGWATAGLSRAWAAQGELTPAAAGSLDTQLGLRRGTAKHRAADAQALVSNTHLMRHLAAGLVSAPVAHALARELDVVPAEELADATQQVLTQVGRDHGRNAPTRTWAAQARRLVDERATGTDRDDPAAAAAWADAVAARKQAAYGGRSLTLTSLGDDMGELVLRHRIDLLIRIKRRAEALTRRAADPRLTDTWRTGPADTLAQLCLTSHDPQNTPGEPDGTAGPPGDPAGAHDDLFPGTRLPDHATRTPDAATPATPARTPDAARTATPGRIPDTATPATPARTPDAARTPFTPGTRRTPGTWAGGGPLATVVFLTISHEAAHGTTDTPALLHGAGQVTAALARTYLDAPGTLVVDIPVTGDGRMDTTTPPPGDPDAPHPDLTNRLWMIARDHTCIFPGCPTPAHACDLDHILAKQHGGKTTTHNQGHQCGRDHALKHSDDCTVTGDANTHVTITLRDRTTHHHHPPVISPEHLWGTRRGPSP